MGNILYLIAAILVIIWAVSFFGHLVSGALIHLLLVVAVIFVLIRLFRK